MKLSLSMPTTTTRTGYSNLCVLEIIYMDRDAKLPRVFGTRLHKDTKFPVELLQCQPQSQSSLVFNFVCVHKS